MSTQPFIERMADSLLQEELDLPEFVLHPGNAAVLEVLQRRMGRSRVRLQELLPVFARLTDVMRDDLVYAAYKALPMRLEGFTDPAEFFDRREETDRDDDLLAQKLAREVRRRGGA